MHTVEPLAFGEAVLRAAPPDPDSQPERALRLPSEAVRARTKLGGHRVTHLILQLEHRVAGFVTGLDLSRFVWHPEFKSI